MPTLDEEHPTTGDTVDFDAIFESIDRLDTTPDFIERIAPGEPLRYSVVQVLCQLHDLDPVTATDALNAWASQRHGTSFSDTAPPTGPPGPVDELGAARRLLEEGAELTDRGEHDAALERYMAAKERFEELGAGDDLATVEMEIGIATGRMGWFDMAAGALGKARAHFEVHGGLDDRARIAQNLGILQSRSGEPHHATFQHRVAGHLWRALDNDHGVADAVHNLASVAFKLGRFEEALAGFEQSHLRYLALDSDEDVADALTAISDVYGHTGRYAEAVPPATEAIEVYLGLDRPVETAVARRVLGHALDHLGRNDEAAGQYQLALEAFDAAGQLFDVAACYLDLSYARGFAGDFDGAVEAIDSARMATVMAGGSWDAAWHERFVAGLRRGEVPTHSHPDPAHDGRLDGPLGGRFVEALRVAADLHGGQRRKSAEGEPEGAPYVEHLLGVAALVVADGGSADEAIAALLHDAVEDTPASVGDIATLFGPDVARIVDACTDAYEIPKPPWRERKEAYVEHLETAPGDVLRVACADKLDNARAVLRDLRDVGESVWDRFNGGKDGTLWYYRTLTDLFLRRRPGYLSEELDRVVRQIEESAT
jgi:tetratricopeptide (TPR) repeat protein